MAVAVAAAAAAAAAAATSWAARRLREPDVIADEDVLVAGRAETESSLSVFTGDMLLFRWAFELASGVVDAEGALVVPTANSAGEDTGLRLLTMTTHPFGGGGMVMGAQVVTIIIATTTTATIIQI